MYKDENCYIIFHNNKSYLLLLRLFIIFSGKSSSYSNFNCHTICNNNLQRNTTSPTELNESKNSAIRTNIVQVIHVNNVVVIIFYRSWIFIENAFL